MGYLASQKLKSPSLDKPRQILIKNFYHNTTWRGAMKKKIGLIIIFGILLISYPLDAQVWGNSKRLTWNSGWSGYPALAADSSSRIHVVWQDATPLNDELFYKKSTDGGATWIGAMRLTWNPSVSGEPALAIDSSDIIHLVWKDKAPGYHQIYHKKSTDGGATWITKRLCWSSGDSHHPVLAIDSNDHIHVIWRDYESGDFELYYRKSTNGGSNWTGTKRLTWASGPTYSPAIAIDSSDNIYIAWQNDVDEYITNYEIFYIMSVDGGLTWSMAKRLTWNSGWSEAPAIAADSSDNIFIAWQDGPPTNREIYYKMSTDGGTTWATKKLTWNPGNSFSPAMVIDANDYIHISWYDYSPGNAEIFYKNSTDGGITWKTKRLTWNLGQSMEPFLAIDTSDKIHVVWDDDSSGSSREIYYKNK
jgi:hypothetical protein